MSQRVIKKAVPRGPALANQPAPDHYLRIKQNIQQLYDTLDNFAPQIGPQSLNSEQLSQIQKALQAGGSNPLNLTSLVPRSTSTTIINGGGSGPSITLPPIVNLIFDGDSLTVGFPSSLTDPYPSKVGQRLGLSPSFITNLGVDGAKTSDVIATHVALADAAYNAALGTNWYILLIGVNDFLNGVPIATTQANIQTIIAGRQAKGFTTLVLSNTPQDYTGPGGTPAGYEAWRNQMRAWYIAGSSGSTYFLNLGDVNTFQNVTDTLFFASDQLHLTDLSYSLFGAAVASFILSSLGGFVDLLPPPQYTTVGTPANTVFESYTINPELFGMYQGSKGIEEMNSAAFERAYTVATALGVGIRFQGMLYKLRRTFLQSLTGSAVRIFSDAFNPTTLATAAPGTVLLCNGANPTSGPGAGTTWLPAVLNFAVANGGNTGPSTSAQTFGLQLDGIMVNVEGGVTAMGGIYGCRQWEFDLRRSGTVANASAAWTFGILFDTGVVGTIDSCYASYCATGIAGGNLTASPTQSNPNSTGPSAKLTITNNVIANCAAGIGLGFTEDSEIENNSINSCTTGIFGNGPRNNIRNNVGASSATNTTDYDEVTVTPGGSTPAWVTTTWKPDNKIVEGNRFYAPVHFRNASGTLLGANVFTSTIWSTDSNCRLTLIADQLGTFPSFTDAAPDTRWVGGLVQSAGTPTGDQGVRGQPYLDTSTNHLWVATVSGTPATWVDTTGSGITALTGPVTASGSGSVASTITPTGVTPGTYTNTNLIVNAAGQITAASNGSSSGEGPGVPFTVTPTFGPFPTFTGGTVSSVSAAGYYTVSGDWTDFTVSVIFTYVSGTINGMAFALPSSPAAICAPGVAIGNGSVGFSAYGLALTSGVCTVNLNAGAALGAGTYEIVVTGRYPTVV